MDGWSVRTICKKKTLPLNRYDTSLPLIINVISHTGPVVDPNPGWKPSGWHQLDRAQQSRQGVKEALIKADLEAGRRPANNMLRCSKLLFDGLYCPIVVADDPAGRQCGHMYERNATLARHIRDHHAGCCEFPSLGEHTTLDLTDNTSIVEPPSQRVSEDEVEAVHKARLMIVAKGIWRDYEFVNPVGQMDGTEFYKIAEDCERRA